LLWFQSQLSYTHGAQESSVNRAAKGLLLACALPLFGKAAFAGLSDRLPAAAYLNPVDQKIAKTGKCVAGRPFPCSVEKTERGVKVIESLPTDRCVRMLPAQHWKGIWINAFEGSQFCPAPAKTCPAASREDVIWLTPERLHGLRDGMYAVEFVGRRTEYKGQYGHLGMSDHEIIVDEPISVRTLRSPTRPMSKAELVVYWRHCEAEGTCIPSKK
jgi:hypothetical protein